MENISFKNTTNIAWMLAESLLKKTLNYLLLKNLRVIVASLLKVPLRNQKEVLLLRDSL